MSKATLSISPVDDLIDVPRQIRVEHLAPGQLVEISTRTVRDAVAWTSRAQFRADESGTVDLTRDAPVTDSSSYDEVSPMGLKKFFL